MARFQDRGDSGLAVSGIFFARNGAVMEEVPFLGAVSGNLAAVCGRIEAAARAAGRPPEGVSLIAVSKTQPAEAVREALRAGQRLFGENRVQEGLAKFPGLRREFPDLVSHLIGPLQTNKVRDAVAHFDVIETVDRLRLAEAIAREMERTGRRPSCFIEVNTGEEAQKAGVLPEAADDFIAECRDRLGLPIVGLMCIPPEREEPALHFALLREIARRNSLNGLSMGMSADFETAIRFGATHVRVGTAIFGARRVAASAAEG
jgi:PLP dependent protein